MAEMRARRGTERRELVRVPVAIPVRYSTEEGRVDVGVLVDLHERGAGLLVPGSSPEAQTLWLQFLWFDDRVGIVGDVASERPTSEGLRLGLRLRPLQEGTREFLTAFMQLFSEKDKRKKVEARKGVVRRLLWERRREPRESRYLPVRVIAGSEEIWAVTEDVSAAGAMLLIPKAIAPDTSVRIEGWGSVVQHQASVVHAESLPFSPFTIHRIGVHLGAAQVVAPSVAKVGPATLPV